MWKQILDMAKRLFMLAEDTKRNHEANKELREEVRRLASAFERLAYEIHRIGEKEEHEREKLVLQLENRLLQFEKLLSSGKSSEEKEKKDSLRRTKLNKSLEQSAA